MSRKVGLKILKNLLFLGIGLALLYMAFRDHDLKALLREMREANYTWVIVSLFFGIVAYMARGLRWLILLEPMGYKPRLSSSVYTIIVGYFANLAIPRIGELTRCTTMSRAESIPVDKLFGTVILERIIDLIILMTVTVLTVLLKVDLFGKFFLDLFSANTERFPSLVPVLLIAFVCVVATLFVLYRLRSKVMRFPIMMKVREFILGLKEGITSIRKIRNRKGFFFQTFLIWLSYYMMTWVVFYSVDETSHLNMIDGLFILVVGGFGMAAPVQGGIGAYHFIVSLGLGVLGVESNAALSYATIVHTSQTLLVLLAGSIALIILYFMKKNVSQKPVMT